MSRLPKNFQPDPYAYHEELLLEVESLSNQAQGVARDAGRVVFVNHALPGETVKARVYRNSPNFSEADLVEVVTPSPHRVEPRCPLHGECGGCQYQHLAYGEQLRWKRQQVAELLQHLAGVEHPVDEVVPSPLDYGYRSKLTPHFQRPKDGRIGPIGFLRQGRRQELVDVPHCPIASDTINEALARLRREVSARAAAYRKGATLLLRDSLDGTVCTDPTEMCEQEVEGLRFSFHAGEFFQNSPAILPAFTRHVRLEALGGDGIGAATPQDAEGDRAASREEGAPTPPSPPVRYLVDAYCGSGLFCLTAASAFEQAVGIEISDSSIDWAQRNAEQNGIRNARFVKGDASAIFEQIDFDPAATAVVIDPPRKGSSPEFLAQLLAFGPRRVVYVSCNPATQARDLRELREAYEIQRVRPFDLFPQTKHLECVVTLERIQKSR